MALSPEASAAFRDRLLKLKEDFAARVERIHDHARAPLEQDSAEQAAQLGNVAVVSALEAEAKRELAEIDAALRRLDAGTYGVCVSCGEPIGEQRLTVRPASLECLECAARSAPR